MKENSRHQSSTYSGGLCSFILVLWICGTIKYRNIWVIIINSFVAPHNTTLYYFLFYVRCQNICLHGWLRHSNGPSPMQSAVYLSVN